MLSSLLDNVRRDALRKGKASVLLPEDMDDLAATYAQVILLAHICREEGMYALEEESNYIERNTFSQELLKKGASMIVNGNGPKFVEEYLTTLYWAREPQGMEALISYCAIRGLCMVQLEDSPFTVEEMLSAVIPSQCQDACKEMAEKEVKKYQAKIYAAEAETYEDFSYEVMGEDAQLVLTMLESQLQKMDDKGIQRLLRDVYNDDLVTAMIGLSRSTRDRIFDNMSMRLRELLISDFLRIYENEISCKGNEQKIKSAAEKILQVIELLGMGED